MGWWVFISLISVSIILMQELLEDYAAGRSDMWSYVWALGFMLVLGIVAFWFFTRTDEAK